MHPKMWMKWQEGHEKFTFLFPAQKFSWEAPLLCVAWSFQANSGSIEWDVMQCVTLCECARSSGSTKWCEELFLQLSLNRRGPSQPSWIGWIHPRSTRWKPIHRHPSWRRWRHTLAGLWTQNHKRLSRRGRQTCKKNRTGQASWRFPGPSMAFLRSEPLQRKLSIRASSITRRQKAPTRAWNRLGGFGDVQIGLLLYMKLLASTALLMAGKVEAAISRWSCLQSSSCQTGAIHSPF